MALDGVEIFTNSSGSHHELRKLRTRIDLIKEATLKVRSVPPLRTISTIRERLTRMSVHLPALACARAQSGGLYLYANQQGCDGDRLYYDGCSFITLNGQVIAQGSQFSLNDVEVVTATVDLQRIRAHRTWSSRSMQAAGNETVFVRQRAETRLSTEQDEDLVDAVVDKEGEFRYNLPEEEIACVPFLLPPRSRAGLVPLANRLLLTLPADWAATGTARRAGCGTTCAGRARAATLSRSAEASTRARRPRSSSPCAASSQRPPQRAVRRRSLSLSLSRSSFWGRRTPT